MWSNLKEHHKYQIKHWKFFALDYFSGIGKLYPNKIGEWMNKYNN